LDFGIALGLVFHPTKKRGEKFSILLRRRTRENDGKEEALRAAAFLLCVLNINVLTDGQFHSSSSSLLLPNKTFQARNVSCTSRLVS